MLQSSPPKNYLQEPLGYSIKSNISNKKKESGYDTKLIRTTHINRNKKKSTENRENDKRRSLQGDGSPKASRHICFSSHDHLYGIYILYKDNSKEKPTQ